MAVLGVEEGGDGGWISTSTSLSMARSLGLGPGTGAREEGACRRGSAACSFIFTAYFFFSPAAALWKEVRASGYNKTEHVEQHTINR